MKVWGHGLGRFEFMNDEECTFSFKLGKVCVTVWEGLYYGSNENVVSFTLVTRLGEACIMEAIRMLFMTYERCSFF